jgi:hypothetical protein
VPVSGERDTRDREREPSRESGEAAAPAEDLPDQIRTNLFRRAQYVRWRARKGDGRGANPSAPIPQMAGAPLPDDSRGRMEPRLGADLSGVRIHSGAESAHAADQMGARAFTVGNDVHFGAGEFAPGTKEGDKLLAHELTHVVQGQSGGVQRKAAFDGGDGPAAEDQGHVSHPEDPAEKEADAVAEHVGDELHGEGAGHGHASAAAAAPSAAPSTGGTDKKISRKSKPSAAPDIGGKKIFRKPNDKSGSKDEGPHGGKRDIDKRPGAQGSDADWVHYLTDLHRFLRDQTGAEKDQLLDIRANREAHPVVGSISEAAASVKARESVKLPDEGIWDQVFSQLNKAHAMFAADKPDIEGAKRELATAVRMFEDAHRRVYEYRSRTEGGAQTAANTLRGIEIGCDITLTILSAGVGAGSANLLKLGARGAFKMIAEQAGKSLVKTAGKAAVVGGANKLAQGAAEEGAGVAAGTEDGFDVAKVLREAGEAAVMNFLGVLIGGSLSKVFMRQLGEILGSRMAPEGLLAIAEKYGVQGAIPPELFVSKGWRFLVGVAGDACTTTLLTALSTLVEQLRTGGKRPTGEQFVMMVVQQMIQNGLLQIVLTAVTHERAVKAASSSAGAGAPAEHGQAPTHQHKEAAPEQQHAPKLAPKGADVGDAGHESEASHDAKLPANDHGPAHANNPDAHEQELAPTGVQREVAQQVKELQNKRTAEKDAAKRKALQVEIEKALAAGRADMEAMVKKIHPTLQPIRPAENLYKIVLDGKEYFGTLEVLLDFKPPPKSTHELGDKLFSQGSKTEDAKVSATGGLAGTSSQGRVNKYPGDVDLAESLRIEAKSHQAAGEALAQTVQHTIATATKAVPGRPPIIFERMTAGKYPQNTAQAGKTIEWLPHDIAAGQKVVIDLDGKQQIITLAQALGAPGDRVVNTFWKGPIDAKGTYGEVTKVMRYEAFDANTGDKLFGTPSIGQAYQEVAFGEPQIHDTNRGHLTDALAPQIEHYAKDGNWVKAVKRAHTVARMNGDMAALNDFAPLMSGENAQLKQVAEHLRLFAQDIAKPGGQGAKALSKAEAMRQAKQLAERVNEIDSAAGAQMKGAIEEAHGDVRGKQALHDAIDNRVLKVLEGKGENDAGYAEKAEKALRAHGYLKEGEEGKGGAK